MRRMKFGAVICVLLIVVLLFSACGEQAGAVTPPSNEPVTEDITAGTEGNQNENSVSEEATTPVETVPEPEDDPLKGLLVSEDVAAQAGGIFLIRDGKYYSLDGSIPSKATNFDYGRLVQSGLLLYTTTTREDMISFGDVPVPVLMDSDKIVMFSTGGDVPQLPVMRMAFKGYTIPLIREGSVIRMYNLDDHTENNYIERRKDKINNLSVCDSAENVVPDERDLERGMTYTISWFSGTQYEETTLVANCNYYVVEQGAEYKYLDGALTKNGYVEFDLSDFPAGLYSFDGVGFGGILEIR